MGLWDGLQDVGLWEGLWGIILFTLIEVGRPSHYALFLAGVLDLVNGKWNLGSSMYSILSASQRWV